MKEENSLFFVSALMILGGFYTLLSGQPKEIISIGGIAIFIGALLAFFAYMR